jgi:hypothetical protein
LGVLHFELRIAGAHHRFTLRVTQPFPRLSGVGVIEVSDRRFREWFAERRHAVLLFLFPDHREPLDVGEVPNVELDVFHIAPASQPWKPVISNSTRNFP